MKLLLVLFLIQSYLSITNKYSFTTTQEFLNQLNNASIDELVYILTKLEQFINFSKSPERKYSFNRAQLKSSIAAIMNDRKIDAEKLGIQVLKENLKPLVSEVIKESDWYQKVSMVINADLYLLKMQMRKPQLGGIIDYVNYLNNDQLDKYLYEVLEKIPSLNEDYSLFENEIINRKPLPEDLIKYLENQNISILNEWGVRIYMYVKRDEQTKCNEIEEIFDITNPQQAFLYINKYLSNVGIKNDYDNFYKHIVYNNHSYPILREKLAILNPDEIRQVSKYVESYHRRATKNPKSFNDLNYYVEQIPTEYLIEYILSQSKVYPELNEENRAKDFNQIQSIASLSNVNNMLMKKERDVIIRWALNIDEYFKDPNNTQQSRLNDHFYSQTTETLLEEMIKYLRNKTGDYSIDKISQLGEPQNDTEQFRSLLLSQYPPVILRKWLGKLQEYHQMNSSSPATLVDLGNTTEIKANLNKYISLYDINRDLFNTITDDQYTMAYGNYASYFYSIHLSELIVWLRKIEEYIKTNRKWCTVIGGIKAFDDENIRTLDKANIIDKLLTYIELFPELKDIKTFDEIIGMYRIHSKIHNTKRETLKQHVKALRKYHDIKLIKFSTSENTENDIKEFVEKADECHLKLYVFKILAILPELNIKSVWDSAMELGDDELSQSFDQKFFFDYLGKLPKEKLIYYCKQCSRYTNSLKKIYIQDDCIAKDDNALLWNITTTVFTSNNEILQSNINFYRLTRGSEEMIYGGLEPFINRQPSESLDIIIKKLPKQLFSKEEIDVDSLLKEERMKKIESIMNIIYKNSLNDLKQIDEYLSTSEINKELQSKSNEQLGKYALVTENYLRTQQGNNAIENFDIVSDKYMQMTNNELIRYITKANLSIDDLEIKSRMVLLTIGEMKK